MLGLDTISGGEEAGGDVASGALGWLGISPGDLTPAALILLVVVLLLWGKIQPVNVVNKLLAARDREIDAKTQEIQDLKAAQSELHTAILTMGESIDDLTAAAQTSQHLIEALHQTLLHGPWVQAPALPPAPLALPDSTPPVVGGS